MQSIEQYTLAKWLKFPMHKAAVQITSLHEIIVESLQRIRTRQFISTSMERRWMRAVSGLNTQIRTVRTH